MKNVFFDLRGGALRVLITDHEAVAYKAVFDRFSPGNHAAIKNASARIARESGVSVNTVHLILPNEAVIVKRFTAQRMPLPDAKKVIRKKIIKEMGIESPVFHLTPLSAEGGDRQQAYIAEIIKSDLMKNLTAGFAANKIKIRSATTAFHANLKAFQKTNPDPMQTCAIFDIEDDSAAVTVLSGSNVVYHETVPLPAVDIEQELQSGTTIERIQKRKVYAVIDVIYNFKVSFLEKHPEYAVEKALLCGPDAKLEGLGDSIKDAVGRDVFILNPFGDKGDDAPLFTGLCGLAAGVADQTAVNLMSAGYGEKIRINRDKLIKFSAAVCAVIILVFAVFTELKYRSVGDKLSAAKKEVEQINAQARNLGGYIKEMETVFLSDENQFVFYPLFRYLSYRIPNDVFVDEVIFKQEKASGVLTFTFASGAVSDIGKKRTLTGVNKAMDGFKALKRQEEPVVSITKEGEKKILKLKIVYKANTDGKI